ncbi:unnamed protein product [Cunninghamella echinulata]
MVLNYTTETFIDDGDEEVSIYYYLSTVPNHNNYSAKNNPNPKFKSLIVLLHGAGGNHQQFSDMVPILTNDHYDVLTCDLRYHGNSQPKKQKSEKVKNININLDFDIMVKDLNRVLEWYDQKQRKGSTLLSLPAAIPIILCGLSMGGMLCQYYCHHLLDQVKSKFIVKNIIAIGCPSLYIREPCVAWIPYYRTATIEEAKEMLSMAKTNLIDAAHTLEAKKKAQDALNQVDEVTLYCCFRACANVSPIQVPNHINHLLIRGDLDIYTLEVMDAWYLDIKQSSSPSSSSLSTKVLYQLIPDANHLTTLDAGQYVANIIVQFLSSCDIIQKSVHFYK